MKHATLTAPAAMSEWEARFRAHVGGPNETWHLMRLYADMQGEEIAPIIYDLANGEFDDDRTEALSDIDAYFAEQAEAEDFAADCDRFERGAGKDWDNDPDLWTRFHDRVMPLGGL